MKTYRLTAAGRRMTLTLMLAALLIWIFAAWALQPALGIRYADLAATLGQGVRQGFGPGQLIPAAILIAMLVAAPLLLWSLWEEWNTSYTVAADALVYETVPGIVLRYPWDTLEGVREADADEAVMELLVRMDATTQIRNPLLRWLHRQTTGTRRIPVYADVEARHELVAEIVRRAGLDLGTPAPAAATTTL